MPSAPILLAAVCGLLAVAGTIHFAMSIWAAKRYERERKLVIDRKFAPPVTILKSLRGLDPHMYEAFRSHCLLAYPEYEVLFGVHDLNDPAVSLVEQLHEEFPLRNLRVVHCPEVLGLNGKVSNLVQMLPQARYEHVIINDSDIVVDRDYLLRVLAPLANPATGMTTALYCGLAGSTLGSRLEALGLSTDFTGGVLVARAMEGGIRFGLGATIATTKTVLREIGGLESLLDYLGDDYELGARVAATGYKIELADTIVETALPHYSFREFWLHQMRWARNIKDRRPAQYSGLIATFGLVWAVLAVLLDPFAWWTWLVLAITTVTRFASALIVGCGVLKDRRVARDLWLLPLRDFVALLIWIASFAGNEVEWRGLRFRLRKGKLERV
ncbi:MAG: bacteriohopanetetrol glucosamine biosynthesis glycosyltransferase HpnI [Candidatus Korobacteraceae bacterium]|jgi:ceramide glucosyltransferase